MGTVGILVNFGLGRLNWNSACYVGTLYPTIVASC